MSDFAKNLKYFRKRKKYSQLELAKKLNYGYTAIANYESGRNEPSFDDLLLLAETLDVTVEELLGVTITDEEKKLLSDYKKLEPEHRQMLLNFLQILSDLC